MNLFAFNIQTGKYDGEDEFAVRRLDGELKQQHDTLAADVTRLNKSASLPKWLLFVMCIVGGFGLICVFSFVTAPLENAELTYAQAYANAPWIIWVGPPCVLIAAAVILTSILREIKTKDSPAYAQTVEKAEKFVSDSHIALGISADAPTCDILSPTYKMTKRGKRKRAIAMINQFNGAWKLFCEGDDLCIGDANLVFKIPFERIGSLAVVKKRTVFWGWNKEISARHGQYKPYKIKKNEYGGMIVKSRLSLQILGDEESEILFPPYEIDTVQRLTGKSAE